jgi:murein DD-endopeptidase MepM/ murein hydrolase activator NlpD
VARHLRRAYDGTYTITQTFGNAASFEPLGWKYPDGSIGYVWQSGAVQGNWHNGIDYALPCGTPLKAQGDGTVVFAGWDTTGFGNCVIVNHDNRALGVGLETLNAHMQQFVVKPGQKVKEGDLIGYSDNTGNSSGCHLHSSVRLDGAYVFIGPYLAVAPPPLKAGPPKDAASAYETIMRHMQALNPDKLDVGALNALINGIKTWPVYKK